MTISSQLREIIIVSLVCALIVTFGGYLWGAWSGAKEVGFGALISLINLVFYTFIYWIIFNKKNVASLGPLIVIKYSILLFLIYCVWAYFDPLKVVAGLTGELLLVAFAWLFIRLFKSPKASYERS